MPHASRDPRILKDMNLGSEDIFEIIRKPPEKGAVRIFEKTRNLGLDKRPYTGKNHTRHSHDSAIIRTSKHGRSIMALFETHFNKR